MLDGPVSTILSRLTFNKGLGYSHYPAEQILYVYDKSGNITGVSCNRFELLTEDIIKLNQPKTKPIYLKRLEGQFKILFYGLIGISYTSTTCLLKAAFAFHQLLLLYIETEDTLKIRSVAEALLSIHKEIEKRTQRPYQYRITLDETDLFQPLPATILTQFPLNQQPFWKQQSRFQKRVTIKNKIPNKQSWLIPLEEKEEQAVNEKDLEAALEAAMANIEVQKQLSLIPKGDTPLVRLYRENLNKLTLEDVYKQTQVTVKNRAPWKLSELVEVIFYISYITLVLDKNGEPLDSKGIFGQFPYGIILLSKKFKTVKFIPPPGRYVSLGPLPEHQMIIDGAIIQKMPGNHNGILSYQEVWATGQWEPEYQQKAIESLSKNKIYLGGLVVDSAYRPKEIGFTDMIAALPEVVDATIPYFYKVINNRIESWFENYEELLKEIGKEVLKNLLTETLKKLAIKYIVKKIGTKIVPVVNVISGVKSAIEEITSDEVDKEYIAVNCVRLYLKGVVKDDQTLASKILANILGDVFEEEIKKVIIAKATQAGIALMKKKKKSSKELSTPSQPQPLPPPAETKETTTPAGKKPTESTQTTDPRLIQEGWKVFHETKKEQEQKALDNKGNTRPGEATMSKDIPVKGEEKEKSITQKTFSENDRQLVNRDTESSDEGFKGGKKKEAGKKEGRERENVNKKRGTKTKEEHQEEEERGKSSPKNKPYPPLEVFTHTTTRKFRQNLVKFFKNNPNHPLAVLYNPNTGRLHPSTKKGMDSFYWEEHPEAMQAGHVRSKHTGARDQVVIMTAAENQLYNQTVETKGSSIRGGFKVAIIDGIPVSVRSAQHLIQYGKLDQKVLDNATIVDVDEL
ncbi:MAG TPA: polymorphic toxin type 5 domain-containing protein [Cytophagaceae bacterium]